MYLRSCLVLMLFLFTETAHSQLATSEWTQAKQNVFLLRNENKIIPVQHLDKTKIQVLSYGFDEIDQPFINTLANYTTIKYVNTQTFYPPVKSPTWYNTSSRQLHIVAINLQVYFIPRQLKDLLMHYKPEDEVILVLFGYPSFMQGMVIPEGIDAVVFAGGIQESYQSIAAQVIFGGIQVQNTLKQALTTQFLERQGLDNGPKIRLGYAPPDEVQMDGRRLRDSIAAIVREGIIAEAFPGAQVMVIKNGWVVYHEAFGKHTYEGSQPVKKTDLYDFASVTKISTSTLAMMDLTSKGQVKLDDPIGRYVPEMRHSNKSSIPLRQFLAHNARLKASIVFWSQTRKPNGSFKGRTFKADSSSNYPIWVTDQLWLHKKYPQKMYKGIKKSPLNPEPGYVYSDLSFILYPLIAQKLTGQPFEAYLKKHFYNPLGAHTLTYNPLRFYQRDQILPTEQDTFFRHELVKGTVHDESAAMLGGISGHAGLFGSANDLAKLATMYKNYGSYGGQQYLNEEVVKEFTRCQYCSEGNRRGLGFERPLITYDPVRSHVAQDVSDLSFGHSGFTGTFVWIDPQHDIVYIFFSNRVYPSRSHGAISSLSIRPRIQQVIYDSMKK